MCQFTIPKRVTFPQIARQNCLFSFVRLQLSNAKSVESEGQSIFETLDPKSEEMSVSISLKKWGTWTPFSEKYCTLHKLRCQIQDGDVLFCSWFTKFWGQQLGHQVLKNQKKIITVNARSLTCSDQSVVADDVRRNS